MRKLLLIIFFTLYVTNIYSQNGYYPYPYSNNFTVLVGDMFINKNQNSINLGIKEHKY